MKNGQTLGGKLRIFICLTSEVKALEKNEVEALHAFKNEIAAAAEVLYKALPPEKADPALHAALSRFLHDNKP